MKARVRYIKRIPFGDDFLAINMFGFILAVRPLNPVELNHELIHTAQMVELGFVVFYLWYVVEWLWLLLKYRDGTKAYFNIRFEREAYRHQNDLNYLRGRKHFRYNS